MNLEILILLAAVPIVLPIIATAFFWKELDRRWLFLIASLLCLSCVANTGYFAIVSWLGPELPNPVPTKAFDLSVAIAHSSHIALVLADLGVFIIGLPILYWLFLGLRRRALDSAHA